MYRRGLGPTATAEPLLKNVAVLATGKSPAGIALDVEGRRVFVVNKRVGEATGSLYALDMDRHTRLQAVPTARRPWSVANNARANRLYVSHYFSRQVGVLDAATYRWLTPIPVAGNPVSIAYDGVADRLYAASMADPEQDGLLAPFRVHVVSFCDQSGGPMVSFVATSGAK